MTTRKDPLGGAVGNDPWWPTGRLHTRSGREPLSREQIVEATIRFVDREGLDALSMRRLGQELGAGATSLYWHIKNRDQLLDLVLDEIMGEVRAEVPPAQAWRDQLAEVARAMRRVLVRHRHLASLLGERPTLGPNALEGLEWLMGTLRHDGFGVLDSALAVNLIVNWASGYAVFECRDPISGPNISPDERQASVEAIGAMLASLPADRFPNVVAMATETSHLTADDQFEYGLARMLDGIEAHLTPKEPAAPPAEPS